MRGFLHNAEDKKKENKYRDLQTISAKKTKKVRTRKTIT